FPLILRFHRYPPLLEPPRSCLVFFYRAPRGRMHPALRADGALALEATAGPEVGSLGLLVPALPPEPVVIRKVRPGGWADRSGLRPGDVLAEVCGQAPADMAATAFVAAMEARPLRMVFFRRPAVPSPRGEDDASEHCHTATGSTSEDVAQQVGDRRRRLSSSSFDDDDNDVFDMTALTPPSPTRGSPGPRRLSAWYCDDAEGKAASEEGGAQRARRSSLGDWYLDGQERPETSTELTVVYQMWHESRANEITGYGSASSSCAAGSSFLQKGAAAAESRRLKWCAAAEEEEALAVSFARALRSEDADEVAEIVAKAEAAGVLADAVEEARGWLEGLRRAAAVSPSALGEGEEAVE
ncbi:unnamed protein product, partial [Prorocentrum cordatum]